MIPVGCGVFWGDARDEVSVIYNNYLEFQVLPKSLMKKSFVLH